MRPVWSAPAAAADAQRVVGPRQPELREEGAGHRLVVVLAGVDEDLVVAWRAAPGCSAASLISCGRVPTTVAMRTSAAAGRCDRYRAADVPRRGRRGGRPSAWTPTPWYATPSGSVNPRNELRPSKSSRRSGNHDEVEVAEQRIRRSA